MTDDDRSVAKERVSGNGPSCAPAASAPAFSKVTDRCGVDCAQVKASAASAGIHEALGEQRARAAFETARPARVVEASSAMPDLAAIGESDPRARRLLTDLPFAMFRICDARSESGGRRAA
jgi:hypothetical protein